MPRAPLQIHHLEKHFASAEHGRHLYSPSYYLADFSRKLEAYTVCHLKSKR